MLGEPTIYDIAKRAGVGIATVSRVLNGSERVSEPTRLAVQRAMVEVGFRPNRAARRLAVRGPNRPRVAALMPFFSGTFYHSVSGPLSSGLEASEIDLVLHNISTRDDKNRVLDRIVRERSCEGLILCSMGIGAERLRQLESSGIAVVSLDYPQDGVPSVTVDNIAGEARATRHLLRGGATRLALISGPENALAFRDREQGFVSVAGSEAPHMRTEQLTLPAGRAAASALIQQYPDIDGIVCVNDVIAVGAVHELRTRGIRVPEDVQVIGFDDQPLMEIIGLSTIRQPMAEFGAWAAVAISTLLKRGSSADMNTVASMQLPTALIARSTTRTTTDKSKTTVRNREPRKNKERP